MARPKAQDKLIVVKHQPGLNRKRRLALVTAVVVAAAVGYLVGASLFNYKHEQAVLRLNLLADKHESLEKEASLLRQQVANLESGRAIDDLAKQEIQDTISQLRADLSASRKDLAFYRNIMAPSDNARGLQVQSSELKALAENRRYAYKIVLAQVAENKSYVSGLVAVNLIGMLGDKQEVLPLRDVSDLTDLGIKFRFRYFQNITGELTLPENFTPDRLQVVAQSKGKKASRIEASYAWQELLGLISG